MKRIVVKHETTIEEEEDQNYEKNGRCNKKENRIFWMQVCNLPCRESSKFLGGTHREGRYDRYTQDHSPSLSGADATVSGNRRQVQVE